MWTDAISFECYGLRIGIRCDSRQLLDSIAARLPPCRSPSPSPIVERLYSIVTGGPGPHGVRRFFLLYQGGARLLRTLNAGDILDALDTDVRLYVAERSTSCLSIHAGVVGWKGHAIVIPGRSMSGKTTMVKAFLDQGATYYSDDCAFVDDRGFAHPYATPLSMRDESTARPRRVPPEQLGAVTGVEPLPVSLVVLTSYRRGAAWRPQPLSPGQAVIALVRHSASVRGHPQLALARLHQMVVNARVLNGVHGDASEVCRQLIAEAG